VQRRPGNIVIQEGTAYGRIVEFIGADLGYERVSLPGNAPVACGKWTLLRMLIINSVGLIRFLKRDRVFEDIVVFGHIGILVRLLGKLRIIRYSRLFSLGFFVHSPQFLFLFRFLVFDSLRNHYIVFSEHELSVYGERLQIDRSRMHFLRYVDWSDKPETLVFPRPENAWKEAYYFSGGYSNRDYLSLIEVFKQIPAKLIIVCSARNTELNAVPNSPNILILRDVREDCFEAYLQHSKAGILPLKHNTGACGQSVMLMLMRNKKASIASDVTVLREYIDNGRTGFLLRDFSGELLSVLNRLESEEGLADNMGRASYQLYRTRFSGEAGFSALREILKDSEYLPAGAAYKESGRRLE
jgi:glycosyltransferase involved in cell wall biosynthesis